MLVTENYWSCLGSHHFQCSFMTFFLQGSVAYVPQQAWILNTTLKENVLFGQPEDSVFYETVLHSCALGPDLKVLPGGDMAEIGEKVNIFVTASKATN